MNWEIQIALLMQNLDSMYVIECHHLVTNDFTAEIIFTLSLVFVKKNTVLGLQQAEPSRLFSIPGTKLNSTK